MYVDKRTEHISYFILAIAFINSMYVYKSTEHISYFIVVIAFINDMYVYMHVYVRKCMHERACVRTYVRTYISAYVDTKVFACHN